MRKGLALCALIAVFPLSGAAQSAPEQALTITLTAGAAKPDPEDSNPLGLRSWFVVFSAYVSRTTAATCPDLEVRFEAKTIFDRRLIEARTEVDDAADEVTGSYDIEVGGRTGAMAQAVAAVRCGRAGVLSAPVTKTAAIPPHACDQGPFRVYELRGRAWREDTDAVRLNRFVPLRRGDFLSEGSWRVGRRSRLVYGARECNGLEVTALSSSLGGIPGSYARRRTGDEILLDGGAVRVRSDRHFGGVATANTWITSAPEAVFGVWTDAPRPLVASRTRIRVFAGRVGVRVRAGSGSGAYARPFRLRAGFESTVRCSGSRTCSVSAPYRWK